MRHSVPELIKKWGANNIQKRFSIPSTLRPVKQSKTRPQRDSFHNAVFPALFVAQIFGLFPVQGISSTYSTQLRFRWMSLRTFYSSISICLSLYFIMSELYNLRNQNSADAKNLGNIF